MTTKQVEAPQIDPLKRKILATSHQREAEGRERQSLTFEVQDPNPYAVHGDSGDQQLKKTMQITIIDVLFNNEVCSLVYLQDLSHVDHYRQSEQKLDSMVDTSKRVFKELSESQKCLDAFMKLLSDVCVSQEQLEAFQQARYSCRLTQLMLRNLIVF